MPSAWLPGRLGQFTLSLSQLVAGLVSTFGPHHSRQACANSLDSPGQALAPMLSLLQLRPVAEVGTGASVPALGEVITDGHLGFAGACLALRQ